MTYQRLIQRNGLGGDYRAVCAHPMIAGDLRRLEADSRDAQHLAALAVFAGITTAQAKTVMDAFFDHRNPTPEEFKQIVAMIRASQPPGVLADSGKEKGIPPTFKASTLRLIADHFDAPQGKKIIISPSSQMREEWAILLNQIADELEGG